MTGTTRPCSTATATPTLTSGFSTVRDPSQRPFTSGCRGRHAAVSRTRRSVTVTLGSPRAALACQLHRRPASTSRSRKKWGTEAQLSAVRRAMLDQIPLREAGSAARPTSAALTAPPGPLPATPARSTPASAARRLASGLAATLPALTGEGALDMAGGEDAGTCRPAGGCTAATAGAGPPGVSPAATITATRWPTGTSSPSRALIAVRTPLAGASTSTVALSVSISMMGSPFATVSPSPRSHATTRPVSWFMPSAGMITSAGNRVSKRHTGTVPVEVRLRLTRGGEWTGHSPVALTGHQQLLRREPRDHLAAVRRHHELLFDPGGRPAVSGRPEGLQRKAHVLPDHLGMVERDQAAEDRLLPVRQATAVPELKGESCLLVREAELARIRPYGRHLPRGHPGADHGDRLVEHVATAFVGVDERRRSAADGERPVVAGPVAVEAVDDVEVSRVARSQVAVGVDVGMGVGTLPGDGVDALHELRAHVVEDLGDQADALVLPDARPERLVEAVVGRVDHHAGGRQERDLVLRLYQPDVLHQLLAVHHLDPLGLQGEEDRQLHDVHAKRLAEQAPGLELDGDLPGHVLRAAHRWREGAAHRRDAGARALITEPRAVELVMAGGGAEVPHDRLVAPRQQREAGRLVQGPGADVGGRQVSDVVHVEA